MMSVRCALLFKRNIPSSFRPDVCPRIGGIRYHGARRVRVRDTELGRADAASRILSRHHGARDGEGDGVRFRRQHAVRSSE